MNTKHVQIERKHSVMFNCYKYNKVEKKILQKLLYPVCAKLSPMW